jgi:signal transduction histidine kinase
MRPVDGRLEQLLGPGAAVLTATLDLVPDPIGILWAIRDEAGRVVDFETGYGNPAMDRVIGVPMERAFGRRLVGEVPEFRENEAFTRMLGVVEGGIPAVVETVIESEHGPIGSMTGVFVHRAMPLGTDAVLNLVTDVTAERRLEAELERFAKVAAHDLREPLTAMGLFIGQLGSRLERGRDETNEHLVELLRRTDARARSLVDGILEYARHDTIAKLDREVDLAELAAEVVDSLAAALERVGGAVEIGPLPVVRGARAQLGRVLQNLIANSLKFRSDAPPRVTVSARRTDGYWVVEVRDNGVGIPEELGDEAFTMFRRAHGDAVEGSGIGLAVCRKIVEAHGGAISAQRAEGGGTVVRFSLPAIEAAPRFGREPDTALGGSAGSDGAARLRTR